MKRFLLVALVLLLTACGGGGGGGSDPAPPADSLQGSYTIQGFWLHLSTANETFNFTEKDYAPYSGSLTIGATSYQETITAGGITSSTSGTYTATWTSGTGGVIVLHTPTGDEDFDFRFIDTTQYGHVLELHYGPFPLVNSPYQTGEEWDFWRRL